MLMTPADFVRRVMALPGIPWRKWGADWSGMDCYGLVVLFWREVHGTDLGGVPNSELAAGFAALAHRWPECSPQPGATAWMAWHDGAPTHCGVLVDGRMLLHSDGSETRPGGPRLTRLSVLRRVYGDIRYYRPAGGGLSPC